MGTAAGSGVGVGSKVIHVPLPSNSIALDPSRSYSEILLHPTRTDQADTSLELSQTMNPLRVACRTRSTPPSSPFLLVASSPTCRPALARPSLARLVSSQVPRAKVRSLADIQADQMDILARSAGTQWRSTTEPGELQESVSLPAPLSSLHLALDREPDCLLIYLLG